MRILYFLHDPKPELLRYAQQLAEVFRGAKVEIEIKDSASWLPKETDPKLNKGSKREVERATEDFDLVHAFGYRASWALGDALKGKQKWIFSAFDLPNTLHDRLVEKLNFARAGFCSSDYVRTRLGWAGVDFLKHQSIGIASKTWELPDRGAAVQELDLDDSKRYILAPNEPGTGLKALTNSLSKVQSRTEDVELLTVDPTDPQLELKLAVAHLFVFPQIAQGASLRLLDAMQAGVPVLVPEESGLAEYVDDRSTGLWFESYDTLPDMIAASLQMPIRAESMASAAQIRVSEHFNLESSTDRLGRLYHKITETPVLV